MVINLHLRFGGINRRVAMPERQQILAALADDTRVRMLFVLGNGTHTAGELAGRLMVPASTLSFHLNTLVKAGLANYRKSGRQRLYSLTTRVRHRGSNLLIQTPQLRLTLQGEHDEKDR